MRRSRSSTRRPRAPSPYKLPRQFRLFGRTGDLCSSASPDAYHNFQKQSLREQDGFEGIRFFEDPCPSSLLGKITRRSSLKREEIYDFPLSWGRPTHRSLHVVTRCSAMNSTTLPLWRNAVTGLGPQQTTITCRNDRQKSVGARQVRVQLHDQRTGRVSPRQIALVSCDAGCV